VPNTDAQNINKTTQGRLKKRPEFLAVAASGKKWVSDSVIVQMGPPSTDQFRYGVTATKRVGNAVVRNRCKRRLRAAIDGLGQTNDLKPSDIVLIARHNTHTQDWQKLTKDLQWCLKRLELI
jgi:ribonuclease P protein component